MTRELLPGAGVDEDTASLLAAGVDDVVETRLSAEELGKAVGKGVAMLEAGDVVVVTEPARLASSVAEFMTVVAALTARGVQVRVLSEPALCTGELVDPGDVMVALNALQTRLQRLKVRAGMAAAAAAGRRPGRPPALTPARADVARELRSQGRSYRQIARILGVSASAVRRGLTATPR